MKVETAADGMTRLFSFGNDTALMVRALDFNRLYAEHQHALVLLRGVERNMRRAWANGAVTEEYWPPALSERVEAVVSAAAAVGCMPNVY